MKTKVCNVSDCSFGGKPQPLETGFYHNPNMTDGYFNQCKTCVKKRELAHGRKRRAKRDIGGKATPEFVEAMKAKIRHEKDVFYGLAV